MNKYKTRLFLSLVLITCTSVRPGYYPFYVYFSPALYLGYNASEGVFWGAQVTGGVGYSYALLGVSIGQRRSIPSPGYKDRRMQYFDVQLATYPLIGVGYGKARLQGQDIPPDFSTQRYKSWIGFPVFDTWDVYQDPTGKWIQSIGILGAFPIPLYMGGDDGEEE